MDALEKLKYPVGRFNMPESMSDSDIEQYIHTIKTFPEKIKAEIQTFDNAQLDTPYREGGWTVRQLVHHCADSHMNAYIRYKLALTENSPTIKPYEQDLWANLSDSQLLVNYSLQILEGIHARWTELLKNMTSKQWERSYYHPESKKHFTLLQATANYDWHARHHLGHIIALKQNMNW